jgi:hypothetical protein
MGDICNESLDKIRQVIRESNERSSRGSQQYIVWENSAILSNYEFFPCPCDEFCWCKRHSCTGHYRIKAITFDEFLETYVKLWVPPRARENIKNAVILGAPFSGRQKNAIKPLRWLRSKWSDVLARARGHNTCGLCDSSLPVIDDVSNLYQAKMWSQLFYDCIVPFDSKSKTQLTKAGYADPTRHFISTNDMLFGDLRKLSERTCMDIGDIRNLDAPWDVVAYLEKPSGGQPLSRVLDKMFYAPK